MFSTLFIDYGDSESFVSNHTIFLSTSRKFTSALCSYVLIIYFLKHYDYILEKIIRRKKPLQLRAQKTIHPQDGVNECVCSVARSCFANRLLLKHNLYRKAAISNPSLYKCRVATCSRNITPTIICITSSELSRLLGNELQTICQSGLLILKHSIQLSFVFLAQNGKIYIYTDVQSSAGGCLA